MLSSAPIGVLLVIRVYDFGLLENIKKLIWLFIKVFVLICRISMRKERKLKKVCYDLEVQKQNVVTS